MKYFLIVMAGLLLLGCQKKDEQYFWYHPKALKKAIADCRKQHRGLTCDQLKMIAVKFQLLGAELKQNPQLFGLRIIALQQKISKQEQVAKAKKDDTLSKTLTDNKRQLMTYLAVVSYYESPQGVVDENISQ